MTIINGIEIDNITYNPNDIKSAILNNDPIEDKLNVIIVVSNPCLYATRYILWREFIKRIEEEENSVRLFAVELAYGDQKFIVTDKNNKNHLQIRTNTPLWHKENMINIAVKKLLPASWKAFAWIDADVEFDSCTWATDTLKVLNGSRDVVQLFSHCVDMDKQLDTMNIFTSFGYSYSKGKKYTTKGLNYWHPGFAWAITRKAYEKIGKIYDEGVLGSGDSIMALAFIGHADKMNRGDYHKGYNESMIEFQKKCKGLRLGYVPGVIRHYYHGSKINRKYTERWMLLIEHQYSPQDHLSFDTNGILVPTNSMPEKFIEDIYKYFEERKEDEN